MNKKVQERPWPHSSPNNSYHASANTSLYHPLPHSQCSSQPPSKQNIPLKNKTLNSSKKKIVECEYFQQCYNCQKTKEKLEQSNRNNAMLSESIAQINRCYQDKIQILEETIERYSKRCEELLMEKKQEIDVKMEEKQRFQEEQNKLIETLETVLKEYEGLKQENQSLVHQVKDLEQRQREREIQYKNSEEEVEKILAQRMKEIEELKIQLNMLNAEAENQENKDKQQQKESDQLPSELQQTEIIEQLSRQNSQDEEQPNVTNQIGQQNGGGPLREITNQPRASNEEETRVKAVAQPDNQSLLTASITQS